MVLEKAHSLGQEEAVGEGDRVCRSKVDAWSVRGEITLLSGAHLVQKQQPIILILSYFLTPNGFIVFKKQWMDT